MKKLLIVIMVAISANVYSQEVYHFPKEENFQVFSDCFDELRGIKDKAEERTIQYEQDLEEYKNGQFCVDCKRSARQIQKQEHETLTEHLKHTPHHDTEPATAQMYADLYKTYRADWDPQKKAYDAKFIDCQGKVKVSVNEANDVIKKYNVNYSQAAADAAKIQDPQKRVVIQQQLANSQTLFVQYQQQVQQQITTRSGNPDELIAKLNSQNDKVLNLMNDIAMITTTEKTNTIASKTPPAKTNNGLAKQAVVNTRPKVETTGTNNNINTSQANTETQAYIDASKETNDPIMQATYLSQAKIKLAYEQAHGNNSVTVQQLKQQIAQLEKQQDAQNQQNLQNSLNRISGTATVDATQNLMNLIDLNSDLESQKDKNKEGVQKSMNDFFNTVSFSKKSIDTIPKKSDTTRSNKPKQIKIPQ